MLISLSYIMNLLLFLFDYLLKLDFSGLKLFLFLLQLLDYLCELSM